jgi:hypothetical protein
MNVVRRVVSAGLPLARARPRGSGVTGSIVSWYRIDPRYLRQADLDGLTLAYVSHGELDTGHLALHLDRDRSVARFELAYDRFPGHRELLAEWDRAAGLRVGEVDGESRIADAWGPRPKMSPIVRHYRRVPAAVAGTLLGYVERSADLLDARHRRLVVSVLRDALYDAARSSGDAGGPGRPGGP